MKRAAVLIVALAAQGIAFGEQRTRIGNPETLPSAGMLAPQILSSTAPSYTSAALVNRIEGTVTIEAESDIEGNVKILRVMKGLGHGLDEMAQAAVRSWRFAPARRNGAAVSAITQIDVDFKLPLPDVVRVGGGVTAPSVLHKVNPKHTPEAQQLRCYGTAVIESLIKPDGSFEVIRVVRGLDYGLTESAIDALKQWEFKPAERNGKPVPVAVNVEVNFDLKGDRPKTDCSKPK